MDGQYIPALTGSLFPSQSFAPSHQCINSLSMLFPGPESTGSTDLDYRTSEPTWSESLEENPDSLCFARGPTFRQSVPNCTGLFGLGGNERRSVGDEALGLIPVTT